MVVFIYLVYIYIFTCKRAVLVGVRKEDNDTRKTILNIIEKTTPLKKDEMFKNFLGHIGKYLTANIKS